MAAVPADLDVEQMRDRSEQELERDQAADQGDAEAGQRFLVGLSFMPVARGASAGWRTGPG